MGFQTKERIKAMLPATVIRLIKRTFDKSGGGVIRKLNIVACELAATGMVVAA